MTQLVWTPPVGSAITFETGLSADIRLLELDGIGPVSSQPITSKAPGQAGSSLLDVSVAERVVVAQAIAQAAGIAAAWTARAALAAAMANEPLETGAVVAAGLLTLKRGGSLDDVEIDAIASSIAFPMTRKAASGLLALDAEWFCPSPFWRATEDTDVTIAAAATPTPCPNDGDALAYPLFRIFGSLTAVTVTNLTTGRAFAISGAIADDEYVEIDTTPGAMSIELVSPGPVRTNWMSHLDVSTGDLFPLAVGANSVQWTRGAAGGSGPRDVLVRHRDRFRGV